ncbi:MAG: DUF2092 domain-containing protein [Fimbriimonadales bacterium]|nr:DUF2092 domain-containing protein [Fimbriimonadales bacterium]
MAIGALLLPLALAQPATGDAAIQRLDRYLRSAPVFRVDLEATMEGYPGKGTGSLVFAQNRRLLFAMKWGPSDYTFAAGPWGALELERATRNYAEYPPVPGGLPFPDSAISRTASIGLPNYLLARKVSEAVPSDGRPAKFLGREKIGTVGVDHVQTSASNPMGTATADLWIDDQGRLLRYRLEVRSMMGTRRSEQRYSNWRLLQSIPDAAFKPRIPSGFTPVFFERDPVPVQIGSRLPSFALTAPNGRRVGFDALKGPKGLLIVAVRASCEPSRRLLQALRGTFESLPAKGVNVAYLSYDGKPVPGLPVHMAGKDVVEDRLGLPGTPFLMLVQADGIVRWLYFGSNPEQPDEPKRILETLAPLNP